MTEPITDGSVLLTQIAAKSSRPIGVHLQVADRCNHACKHCYQVQGQKGEMSLEQIRFVLDDLANFGILLLSISGGEATLRPDLPEILAYAKQKGFAIRLYSNAYNIDDVLADTIATVGVLEVHVSVYSDLDAEHDEVTRVPGSLERTLAGIARLRARNVSVVMKSPVLNVGRGLKPRLIALADRLGCSLRLSTEVTPREDGSFATKHVETSPERLIEDDMMAPWTPDVHEAGAREERLRQGSCGVCKGGVSVMPNGEVRPCTDTIVPLGNLTKDRLSTILDTHPAVPLLRSLSWQDVHGCRDCDLLLACGRCHASAAHEGGDYLGPYRSSCAIARARYAAGVGELTVLDPDDGCEAGRSSEIGPYRIEAPGRIRPVADRQTAQDQARGEAFPWLRPKPGYVARMVAGAGPGDIIQLRLSNNGPVSSEDQPMARCSQS